MLGGACGADGLAIRISAISFIALRDDAARSAAREARSLADHLSHLVVHGILHLLGYDHQTAGEAAEMEALEARVLASLGIADPYAASRRAVTMTISKDDLRLADAADQRSPARRSGGARADPSSARSSAAALHRIGLVPQRRHLASATPWMN